MKRSSSLGIVALCLLCLSLQALAQPSTAFLSDTLALVPGVSGAVRFRLAEAAAVTVSLMDDGGKSRYTFMEHEPLEPGEHGFPWDGTLLDGSPLAQGHYKLVLTGGKTEAVMDVRIDDPLPQLEAVAEEANAIGPDASPNPGDAPAPKVSPNASYWEWDAANLDIASPESQATLWATLQQPITVLDVGPKEHVYPVREPGLSPKIRDNVVGQLHGQTQGVRVLDQAGEWSLVEAYSNDGNRARWESMKSASDERVCGWVKTALLKTVQPYERYGLVVDKLTQRLYLFEAGKLKTTLLVSTGKPTKGEPHNETTSGEFITDSWVGEFQSNSMYCSFAIRINGGVLLHEVPHQKDGDGAKRWGNFELYLGQKASHGCVRVQRQTNADGIDMEWLWDNLKRGTKVLILDDTGRSLPLPKPDTPFYYNPDKGQYYHALAHCQSVSQRFLPLTGFVYGQRHEAPFDKLTPCPVCAMAWGIDQGDIPADIIGGSTDGL